MIPLNKYFLSLCFFFQPFLFHLFSSNQLFPVDGSHFGRPWYQRHGSGQVCLVSENTSSLRVPEAPHFRRMLTGPEVFLGMPGASGLRPCTWTHLKKGLVPHSSGWWDGWQIPLILTQDYNTPSHDSIRIFYLRNKKKKRKVLKVHKKDERMKLGEMY